MSEGYGYDMGPGPDRGEDRNYGDKPLDRSRRYQEQERFRQPAVDPEIQERLKKIPMPGKKAQKFIGIAVCVVVVLMAGFMILSGLFGPEKAAETYAEAVLNGEWEQVYGQMEIPEGILMTKEHFLAAHPEEGGAEVTNLNVEESGDASSGTGEFLRWYTVQYMVKGESSIREMRLQLIRQPEKAFLLFPKWKVSSEDLLVKNFVISVPAGCEIAVDGETLTPASLAEENGSGYDTYMENLFVGEHTIQAAAENRETEEFRLDLTEGMDYYEIGQLNVSADAVSEMQTVVQEFVGKIYGEALAQSGPSGDYLNYWAQTGNSLEEQQYIQESAVQLYERLVSDLQSTYYDKIQFTDMSFRNFQSQVNEYYTDEAGNFYVQLYVTYQYAYAYTGTETSYSGITTKEEVQDEGNSDLTVTFKLENEKWKVYSMDLSSVY